MQVWNRAQQKLTQEPVVGEGAMRFVYETAFGRMLAKGILCRKPISNLYGVLQRSRLTRGKVRRFIRQYDISPGSACHGRTRPRRASCPPLRTPS